MKSLSIYLTILIISISSTAVAQVGIGTTSPASILDVTSTQGGILIPRMTAAQATAIAVKTESELVYVTDTDATFTESGFYFWDGSAWQPIGGNGGIYRGDGTAPADVDVAVTDHIDFDNSTFFIDGTNNRVGVGGIDETFTNHAPLEVVNTTSPTNQAFATGIPVMRLWRSGPRFQIADIKLGKYQVGAPNNNRRASLTFALSGEVEAPETTTDVMTLTGEGHVGIGTERPFHPIDLGGALEAQKLAIYQNSAGTDFYGFGVAAGKLQIHAANTPSGDADMVITSTGRVGIREDDPTHDLHINGNVRFEGLATDGTPSDRQVVITSTGELKQLAPNTSSTSYYSGNPNVVNIVPNSTGSNSAAFTHISFANDLTSNNITRITAPGIEQNMALIADTGIYSLSVTITMNPSTTGWNTSGVNTTNELYVDIRKNADLASVFPYQTGEVLVNGSVSFTGNSTGAGIAPQVTAGPKVIKLNAGDRIFVSVWHRGSGTETAPGSGVSTLAISSPRSFFSIVQLR